MKTTTRLTILVGVAAMGALLVGYTAESVDDGGTIQGTIRLQGSPPPTPAHTVEDSSQHAACGQSVANDAVITGSGGALANAVVSIEGIQRGARARPTKITLDQDGCRFRPRVQAAARGSQVTVVSSDPTLHNVHTYLGNRTLFNLAMPTKGMRVTRRLVRPGMVTAKCDAGHTWMRGYIHVFEHPYYDVTGRNGRFELENVPPGRHRVKVWHEVLGEQTGTVTVTPGGSATWDVALRAN